MASATKQKVRGQRDPRKSRRGENRTPGGKSRRQPEAAAARDAIPGMSGIVLRNGGGTGGGPETMDHTQFFDGRFAISANQVELLSRPPDPPAPPGPNLITVLAAGLGMDGKVNVRGSQGVRITAGPPPLPPTASDSTNGVEIMVGEIQNVTIQRGLLPGIDQKIEMTPAGITVDAGAMPVTIQSLTQITLSVAGGLSTITLGPQGITIQGLLIQIN